MHPETSETPGTPGTQAPRNAQIPQTPQTRRGTRQRHDALLGLLREGVTHVDELSEALGVSPSTVRRDLGRLTEDRKVARTYGGAVVPEAFQERPVAESARVRQAAKAAVAAAALPLVPATGAVFIDAGTTCAAFARRLADEATGETRALVVTRGLETAALLADAPGIDVLMLGGSVRPLSHGLVGPLTELALDRLSFAVAFLGADAVDPARGVGEPTLEETAVKERVAARSSRVVVLADSTKLAVEDAPAWAWPGDAWTLVTDTDAPSGLAAGCAANGVSLLLAE
ncbi:DeoR/GlpR family DNA-binding transcription regulator [Streptomyces iconiensis]|uniref:DeoR/GlpR family DNA-binding transcription regulator n=1 Tax=Streptomyces iconiensis TaxID=1384038 RepID=A0ABT7A001_9ACTN|nr:DeoR/GlpR family DNA-binding transcription regulator [Streptomyces iconiensis]MDJ1134640.1 DeoR/GlpR family DNA-binding transcription regulator [Streptomyces iconiensis]